MGTRLISPENGEPIIILVPVEEGNTPKGSACKYLNRAVPKAKMFSCRNWFSFHIFSIFMAKK